MSGLANGGRSFRTRYESAKLPELFSSGFAHYGLDVLHQKEQVKRIRWARFKLPMEVPLPGRLVLGMHQQCTNSGNVRRLCGAQQRIFEQCFAKPCALVLKVHGKPGQNHHRHGVLCNAFGHTRCRNGLLHTANRQAVETNDRARMAAHVGLGTIGFLVDERKALQKLVQSTLATIKRLRSIRCGQFANWLVSLRTQPSSPGSDKSFLSLGLALTG